MCQTITHTQFLQTVAIKIAF